MTAGEGLGFGTQISLDGGFADVEKLGDVEVAKRLLEQLVTQVEPQANRPDLSQVVTHRDDDGLSAAIIGGETSAVLHSFPDHRAVTLQLFSAHDLPLSSTTKLLLEAYDVGRFQSSVRGFGRYLPREPEALAQALVGERSYARLRIVPPPTVTL